jgi:hypothetical protein
MALWRIWRGRRGGIILYPETVEYLKELEDLLKRNGIEVTLSLLNDCDHLLFKVYDEAFMNGFESVE